MAKQFILISPKKAEQSELVQNELHQNISRRRMAFRPQSLKKIISAATTPLAQKSDPGGEGSSSTATSEIERSISSNHLHPQFNVPTNESDKSRRVLWTLPEQVVFYEALKMHGKDFEAIAKFMSKRKINKDKEQLKNFFINTYKFWKSKMQIDETEWANNFPRDARELFLLINGWEWRRRRLEPPFWMSSDKQRFKSLVFDGILSFRPKRKKFLITIRTPYCPALLKYFPYDKRGAEIPTFIRCKLKPMCNKDREYITVFCQQNPYLQLIMNVNEKISTIFTLLEKKWSNQLEYSPSNLKNRVKLILDNNVQVHKILIGIGEESSPLLSLNRLKKDLLSKRVESNEMKVFPDVSTTDIASHNDSNMASSSKDIFEISEDKIRHGLTWQNVGNASMLQLFYLLGMNSELIFNYEIITEQTHRPKPWEIFVSLVNRDYDGLIAKSTNPNSELRHQTIQISSTSAEISNCNQQQQLQATSIGIPKPSQIKSSNIVEEENQQFIKQIRAQSTNITRKPRRQIKLLPDAGPTKKFSRHNGVLSMDGKHIMSSDKHDSYSATTQSHQSMLPSSSSLQPIDYSNRIVQAMAEAGTDATNNELSLDSSTTAFSTFQSVMLDNSPNKSLPDDVRNAMSEMLKESSVDYCRKFEKLTRMHQ